MSRGRSRHLDGGPLPRAKNAGERDVLLVMRALAKEDPEVARLAHMGSTWDLIDRLAEQRPVPRSIAAARRLLGRGVPLSSATGKPRDSADSQEAQGESS